MYIHFSYKVWCQQIKRKKNLSATKFLKCEHRKHTHTFFDNLFNWTDWKIDNTKKNIILPNFHEEQREYPEPALVASIDASVKLLQTTLKYNWRQFSKKKTVLLSYDSYPQGLKKWRRFLSIWHRFVDRCQKFCNNGTVFIKLPIFSGIFFKNSCHHLQKKKTSLPTPSCLCSGIPISKTCIPLEMCQFTQKNGWLERSKFNKNIKLHLLRNVKKIHNQFYPLNHKDSVYFFYKKKWTTLNAFKKIPKNVTNHVKTWPKGFKCQSKQKSCLLNFVNRSYLLNKVC